MAWFAGQLFTNPPANTVILDTGSMVAGYYEVSLVLSSNTGLELILQHRNAANATTLRSKIIPVTFSVLDIHHLYPVEVNVNERLRLVTRADVVGEVEASVFALRPPNIGAP